MWLKAFRIEKGMQDLDITTVLKSAKKQFISQTAVPENTGHWRFFIMAMAAL